MLRATTVTMFTLLAAAGLAIGSSSHQEKPKVEASTNFCEVIWTSASPITVGPICFAYDKGVTCLDGSEGVEPDLVIYHHLCVPSLLGS
jgi:hypothetical protein